MKSLILELPGILENQSTHQTSNPLESLQLPTLTQILSKADQSQVSDNSITKYSTLELTGKINPAFAARYLKISSAVNHQYKYWFRADPMVMQTDISTIHMTGNRHFSFSEIQLNNLEGEIQKSISHLDATFVLISEKEGYLACNDFSDVKFVSPLMALGQNQLAVAATGKDSSHWNTLLTEIQMSLFGEVFPNSMEAERIAVNSLHFWGDVDAIIPNQQADCVISDSNLLLGIASARNLQVLPFKEININKLLNDSNQFNSVHVVDMELLWLRRQGLVEPWLQKVEAIEQELLTGIVEAIKSNLLEEVLIIGTGNVSYRFSKKHLNRFWRRIKPVSYFLEEVKN